MQKYTVRFTVMLSGGDSKTYDSVVCDRPYGESIGIEKEDCVNQSSKESSCNIKGPEAVISRKRKANTR